MLELLRASPRENAFWEMVWRPWSDHRIVFPKLLYALDFRFAGATGALLVFLNLACQAGVALIVGAAVKRQHDVTAEDKWILASAGWVACFWLVMSGNMLWGFQIAWFLNALAVAGAILFACDLEGRTGWSTLGRGVGAMLLATIASFSLANGLLIWCVLGFLLWRNRAPVFLQLTWWLCALLVAWGGLSAAGGGGGGLSLLAPRNVPYFFTLLGNPVSRIHPEAGLLLGAVGFTGFLIFAVRFLLKRMGGFFHTFAFAQTAYVVMSAWLIASGRSSNGVEHAASSRYYPPVVLFWCLLFGLAWLVAGRYRGGSRLRAALAIGAAAVVGAGQAASFPERAARLVKSDLASLAVAANVGDSATLHYIHLHPDSATLWNEMAFAKSRNLSLYRDPWLRTFGQGVFDRYELSPDAEIPARWQARTIVTLPDRPGLLLQGHLEPSAAGEQPAGILITRAGRIVGYAGLRGRSCDGCFSGYASTFGETSSGTADLNLYAVYNEADRFVRRLVEPRDSLIKRRPE